MSTSTSSRLGQHRDRGRRRVDAALRLGRRHPLDAVHAALVLEEGVRAVAADLEHELLEPARVAAGGRERLGLEPVLLGEAGQHLVQVAGEERGLVAAGPGPQLDDHVLVVGGIALDHGEPQILLDPGKRRSRLRELLLRERAHLGIAVGRELGRLVLLGRELAPPARELCRAREPLVLARHLRVAALVREHGRVAQLSLELGMATLDLCNQRFHRRIRRSGRAAA